MNRIKRKEDLQLDESVQEQLDKYIQKQLSIPSLKMKNGGVIAEVHKEPIQLLSLKGASVAPIPISSTVTLKPLSNVLSIRPDAISTEITPHVFDANSKSIVPVTSDSELTSSVSLGGWTIQENKLNFSVQIFPDQIQNSRIYLFKVKVALNTDPKETILQDLDSWDSWSVTHHKSSNEDKNIQDGDKTVDLLQFLEQLRSLTTESIRNQPPILGHFCYLIDKK